MKFDLERSIEVLSATPAALRGLLSGVSEDWTRSAGVPEKWEAYDVVGHLVHGEKTDWIPRAKIILAQGGNPVFEPFDRTAQFGLNDQPSLAELIDEFESLRNDGIQTLRSWEMVDEELELKGIHPEFGEVSMRQLIAAWVVHDLNHISQISSVMARKYAQEVGPWTQYLGILKQQV